MTRTGTALARRKHRSLVVPFVLKGVPPAVAKSMNHCHDIFSTREQNQNVALVESRKWGSVTLDFSGVKGMDELSLSSRVLYAEAGKKEMLDYDLIKIPLHYSNGKVHLWQTFLGFKVGTVSREGDHGGRKIARKAVTMSKMAEKDEQAKRRAESTASSLLAGLGGLNLGSS